MRRSTSFKVTNDDTNRKQICDFLLVITCNTNGHPISYRLKAIADYCSNFGRKTATLRFRAPFGGLRAQNIHRFLSLHCVCSLRAYCYISISCNCPLRLRETSYWNCVCREAILTSNDSCQLYLSVVQNARRQLMRA